MEKIKKFMNILPWILVIAAITVIVAEVRYINIEKEIYNNYKTEMAETISNLQSEAADLQSKADFFQEQINAYSSKPDEWQKVIDDLSGQLKQIYIADSKALDALAKDLFMKAADKIAKNDYSTFHEFPDYRYSTDQPLEITKDGSRYKMKYDAFRWIKNEYYDIFTGGMLDKVLDKRFTEIEGYFYVKEAEKGATEWGVVNAELTRVSETDDEIKYSVKYDRQEQGKITAKGLTCTMTIKYEEGRYRVSDTNLGNL